MLMKLLMIKLILILIKKIVIIIIVPFFSIIIIINKINCLYNNFPYNLKLYKIIIIYKYKIIIIIKKGKNLEFGVIFLRIKLKINNNEYKLYNLIIY